MLPKNKSMGNRHVCLYRTLNKNIIKFRIKTYKNIINIKISKSILQIHIYISNECHISKVSSLLYSAIAFAALYSNNIDNLGYVALNGNVIANMFYTWGSWFISFSNFIPISLLVTV